MNQSREDYVNTIKTLRSEKQALQERVAEMKERNTNQAMLLKRLESSRQADRKEFEAEVKELKEALAQERIKNRQQLQFGPLSPSASNRSLVTSLPPVTNEGNNGESTGERNRRVSRANRDSWRQEVLSSEPLNTVIVQSAFLDAAIKKKEKSQRGFWGKLFAPTTEPEEENPALNASIAKITQESRTSILSKDIMQAMDENKRLVQDREESLRVREEVQRFKEDALKNFERTSQLEKQGSRWNLLNGSHEEEEEKHKTTASTDAVNLDNLSKIQDSDVLDVDTLRRLIADRTAGMGDDEKEEGKVATGENAESDSDESSSDDDEEFSVGEAETTEVQ